jgi:hypothetical protein
MGGPSKQLRHLAIAGLPGKLRYLTSSSAKPLDIGLITGGPCDVPSPVRQPRR